MARVDRDRFSVTGVAALGVGVGGSIAEYNMNGAFDTLEPVLGAMAVQGGLDVLAATRPDDSLTHRLVGRVGLGISVVGQGLFEAVRMGWDFTDGAADLGGLLRAGIAGAAAVVTHRTVEVPREVRVGH